MDRRSSLIVVTGAAGAVARMILPALREHYHLRLIDLNPIEPVDDDEILTVDVTQVDDLVAASKAASAIVHLAGYPFEADFIETLLPSNIVGTWSVYEAARRAGVPRVIFASSLQTVLGYTDEPLVTTVMPPRPATIYGCTKVWGEAMARHYSDLYAIQSACLRFGWTIAGDSPRLIQESWYAPFWCSPDDAASLVVAALASDVRFAVVNAVSPPANDRYDTSNPFGWTPRHRRVIER